MSSVPPGAAVPGTWGSALAGVSSLAGTALQIYGQMRAASIAKQVAQYNAAVAERNAQAEQNAAEIQAQQFLRQAEMDRQDAILAQQAQQWREARQQEQQARVLGQTRAIVASSGLLMEGSPLAVFEETVRQQTLDRLAGEYQTKLQVRAAGEAATMHEYAATVARYGGAERVRVGRAQAGLLSATGDEAMTAGVLQAAGTASKGLTTAAYLTERAKNPTLTPSLLG